MLKKDKIFGYIFIGFIILMMCLCMAWWISDIFKLNMLISICVGIAIGVIVNIISIREMVNNLYKIDYKILIAFYIAYNIGILGFFMGVPLFNVLMGIVLGYYIGRRAKIEKKGKKLFLIDLNKANGFGLIILLVVLLSSSLIALIDPYTGSNLKGMLHLNFDVNIFMIWLIIIIGGTLLMLLQSYLTKRIAKYVYDKKK